MTVRVGLVNTNTRFYCFMMSTINLPAVNSVCLDKTLPVNFFFTSPVHNKSQRNSFGLFFFSPPSSSFAKCFVLCCPFVSVTCQRLVVTGLPCGYVLAVLLFAIYAIKMGGAA